MIYIRVEMWPMGDKSKARLLGEATIANVGGDGESGNYQTRLLKSPEYAAEGNAIDLKSGDYDLVRIPANMIWKTGAVVKFPRKRLGPWDLLFRALRGTVGGRT